MAEKSIRKLVRKRPKVDGEEKLRYKAETYTTHEMDRTQLMGVAIFPYGEALDTYEDEEEFLGAVHSVAEKVYLIADKILGDLADHEDWDDGIELARSTTVESDNITPNEKVNKWLKEKDRPLFEIDEETPSLLDERDLEEKIRDELVVPREERVEWVSDETHYEVEIYCYNCQTHTNMAIKKGTVVGDALEGTKCPNCECTTLGH